MVRVTASLSYRNILPQRPTAPLPTPWWTGRAVRCRIVAFYLTAILAPRQGLPPEFPASFLSIRRDAGDLAGLLLLAAKPCQVALLSKGAFTCRVWTKG